MKRKQKQAVKTEKSLKVKKWEKSCPKCGKSLEFSTRGALVRAIKTNSNCVACSSAINSLNRVRRKPKNQIIDGFKRCDSVGCKNPLKNKYELLPVSEFYKTRSMKSGVAGLCKHCKHFIDKQYSIKNKDKKRIACYRWAAKNKVKVRGYKNKWRLNNISKVKEAGKQYRLAHKLELKEYRAKNKDNISKRGEIYRKTHKVEKAKKDAEYKLFRSKTDINFRLKTVLRSRLNGALRAYRADKKVSHVKDLGCSVKFFVRYIEILWLPEMSWGNYGRNTGQWSLDHIKALANFDLTKKSEQKKAVHYTNIQPLWHIDNIRKGNR